MSWIIPMRHRFLTPNLPVSILLRCERRTITNTISSLTPTALIVVPKRQFGQGKKIRIYGHSKVKAANPAPVATYFLYLLPVTCMGIFMYEFIWKRGNTWQQMKQKLRSRMSEFSALSDSILPIKHPMERIEITDDMPQWKKDKIEATRKRVASLHKSKQDLIEGNASWSTVKEREMNEIKANIAENAMGGATRGPLPFKRWLLNREHRLKLKEEENAKKRAEEEAEHQKSVEAGTSWKEGFEKYYYGIGMAPLGPTGGNQIDYRRVQQEGQYRVQSIERQLDIEDNKKEMHEYMRQKAKERYQERVDQLAKEDPEIKALLEGQDESQIKPTDQNLFQLKKQWVSDWKNSSLKAETVEADCSVVEEIDDLSDNELNIEHGISSDDDLSMGFKARKIIEYENRIRQYSTPDKIFRYFASYKISMGHDEIMMTPEDFLRSITPGMKQPENLGLDRYITINLDETNKVLLDQGLDESSIFYQLGAGGLISFSDYIFLLTVLSTSRRHFEIAFKMFDLNGDGDVDAKEFEVVTNLMKSQSNFGAKHRDHGNTGSSYKGINSGLTTYFFGENKEGNLTVDKFLEFQRQLQNEILRLEFNRKSSGSNTIPEKAFVELLIAYAGFPDKKKSKMIRRVRKTFKNSVRGVTLEDYLNFYQVLNNINDIDTALQFYHIAGAPIERSTMKHVAHTVAGVDLSDHIIDVVFVLFDNDGDGKLSNKEFVSVMKQRAMRGLEKPKDTGIAKICSAMTKCASDLKPSFIRKD